MHISWGAKKSRGYCERIAYKEKISVRGCLPGSPRYFLLTGLWQASIEKCADILLKPLISVKDWKVCSFTALLLSIQKCGVFV